MNVTITLIICLSLVFVITLGIVSSTLRDKNFKVRFDDRNKRLMRIILDQRDELISYREAIKKNDANLERSLNVLASASDAVNSKISRLKDTEELLSKLKVEIGEFNLGQDRSSKKMDEAIRSFSSYIKKINDDNVRLFPHFEERLVSRPSYLSPEEKKHFKEYMQSAAEQHLSERLQEAQLRQIKREHDGLHKWITITPRLKLLCRIDEQGNLLQKELDRIKKVKQTLGIK